MRTEALFFKTLFLVFLSFYIVSYFIFLILVLCIEMGEYSTINLIDFMEIAAFAPFLLGFTATIFFSPVLLLVCFIQWWIKSKKIKNTISFIVMILYGYVMFAWFSGDYEKFSWIVTQDEAIYYVILLIPSTLLFMVLLSYLAQYKKSRRLP